jgi:hypothetical protein
MKKKKYIKSDYIKLLGFTDFVRGLVGRGEKESVIESGDPPTLSQLFSTLDIIFEKIAPIGGFICLVFVVLGGYMWMTSAGDPIKIKKAQGTLTWALIGLIFLVISGVVLSSIIKLME